MILNNTTSQIAKKTNKPLSTIQRRARRLTDRGIIKAEHKIDYIKMGFKTGLIHIYVKDGDAQSLTKEIIKLDHVQLVSIHLGNSDIVAEYICRCNQELLDLIREIKHLGGIDRVVWSEEVYRENRTRPLELLQYEERAEK